MLDAQPPRDDRMAEMGTVAPPGAGPETGAGTRIIEPGWLAFGAGRGWDCMARIFLGGWDNTITDHCKPLRRLRARNQYQRD